MSELSVPGYEIKGVLGQGGFGVVYLALQSAVGREVALKVDNRVLLSERDQRRFLREVTAAGALSGHPHVVPVYDAGVLPDGRPYMVLELCPGGSLAGRVLSPADARDVGVRIADALAAAHAQGVLHRDVKPANILLNRYGQVALSDFGLATMPASGPDASVTRESLTPSYAPPEAFELAEPSPAGDVYALAATVYALLSGRPPRFPESGVPNLAMILALHRLPVPDIPGVPPELTAVLRRALTSDPRHRTPSAATLRDELAAVPLPPLPARPVAPPMHHPASFTPGRPPQPTNPPNEQPTSPPAAPHGVNKVLVAIIAALSLVIVAGAGVFVYTQIIQQPPAREQETAAAPGTATTTPKKKEPSVFTGLDTYTENCPAARIKGGGAACVREAECWGGLVIIVGDTKARRLGCEESHSWETFAVAPIPKDAETYVQQDLARHPTVKKVCSRTVLLATRTGTARSLAAGWEADVMPPSQSQFEDGVRFYRCIASRTGVDSRKSYFH
ncbi:serine/threonine-protein kinase [Nonomuraea gerenzanensis]|uniref:non-specific serine/threonine protein kinase n=1 Tax=Nonomuraea gerenzanensis TaxID=93944 RepID=A0A1M4E1P1_9ACTN|nr:serine/threonine-protein kinase [Nonomuraea gerenzanensis]UBU15012.1 protein kinase [Nonomuraea gerenzanensis]SBO92754.1 Serine/threonine protein kinase [Nonomuraea gerenzanensis]